MTEVLPPCCAGCRTQTHPFFGTSQKRWSGAAARTLFVGDSDVDIRTARNGGLTSCGVLWGFRGRAELEAEGADCLARTPEELVKAVLGDG